MPFVATKKTGYLFLDELKFVAPNSSSLRRRGVEADQKMDMRMIFRTRVFALFLRFAYVFANEAIAKEEPHCADIDVRILYVHRGDTRPCVMATHSGRDLCYREPRLLPTFSLAQNLNKHTDVFLLASMNAYELSKFALQFIIVCLNLSIIAFVCCESRKDPAFRSSFFLLFTAVSVSEFLHTTTVGWDICYSLPSSGETEAEPLTKRYKGQGLCVRGTKDRGLCVEMPRTPTYAVLAHCAVLYGEHDKTAWRTARFARYYPKEINYGYPEPIRLVESGHSIGLHRYCKTRYNVLVLPKFRFVL